MMNSGMKEIALSSRKQAYISKNGVRKPLNVFSCLAIALYFLISFNVQGAEGVELGTISVEIKEDAILVSSDLQLDEDQIEDLFEETEVQELVEIEKVTETPEITQLEQPDDHVELDDREDGVCE